MEEVSDQTPLPNCPMASYPTSAHKMLLQRFCRLCMRESPFLLPFSAMLKEITLADMLDRLLGAFRIKQTAELPNGVCTNCLTKLEYAYSVQKEFVRNEQRLRHYKQHGQLLEKLFAFQSHITIIKERSATQLIAENDEEILQERIEIEPKFEVPGMCAAESSAAATFKSMVPPGGWVVMACDCPSQPSAPSTRLTAKLTKPVRPVLKRPRRNRAILRQAIAAETSVGASTTSIDPCKCYVCGRVMECAQGLRDHLVEHVGMLPYTCASCSEAQDASNDASPTPITSLAMLQRHFRMHSYPLKCPYCPQRFRQHTSVYAHVRYRHEMFDNPEGYTCDVCGVKIRYRPSFMYHIRMHHHEQRGTYRCQYCQRVFGTRARLERHERAHTGERPFACHLCPKTFAHGGQLTTHLSRHNNERGHQCEQCGKAFFNKAMLRQHLESHETVESRKEVGAKAKPRQQRPCPFAGCTHVARTYQAYYMHRLRHEMAHRCEECGRRFARLCELRRHVRIYHSTDKPFKCEPCEKTFLSSQSYREHMDAHSNVRRFECDICDKKFVRRRNLVNHRMSHTNNRPYRCDRCDSTFKYKSDYNRHRKHKHEQMDQGESAEVLDQGLLEDGEETVNEIVLMAEDPIMDGILEQSVQQAILSKENIEIDGNSYGEVVETVEESIVVEQPFVSIGIDEVTKQEYIIEYINHA
uniref:Protein krueppel n=1 Tax=Anopheles farauti TaxID=69004 RepID=A0A182Q9G1_9DIPT